MVYFLNSKVKTHTEYALQYIFDENQEKIVILGYSIVSRRSPLYRTGVQSKAHVRSIRTSRQRQALNSI